MIGTVLYLQYTAHGLAHITRVDEIANIKYEQSIKIIQIKEEELSNSILKSNLGAAINSATYIEKIKKKMKLRKLRSTKREILFIIIKFTSGLALETVVDAFLELALLAKKFPIFGLSLLFLSSIYLVIVCSRIDYLLRPHANMPDEHHDNEKHHNESDGFSQNEIEFIEYLGVFNKNKKIIDEEVGDVSVTNTIHNIYN
jgi:hypothetical protein